MNEIEEYIFDKTCQRVGYPLSKKNITTKYFKQDNFIACILSDTEKEVIGIVKRNPIDPYDFNAGWKRAFNRAVRRLIKEKMPKVTRCVESYKLTDMLEHMVA